MADQSFHLDGQQLAKICKHTLPGQDDELLLSTLQSLNPDYPIRLAKTGEEWYRLGGIVDMAGNRIANDLIEWTERTYIECGKNLQTLIDHAREQKLIATRQTGNTLHFVIQTGSNAEQFIQIDIDKTHEISDRLLVNEHNPPEDLEEFIDPLDPECIERFFIGTSRYSYRRKTDVEVFMDEINKYHLAGQYDKALVAARAPSAMAKRMKAYAALQALLATLQPMPTLFFRDTVFVVGADLAGPAARPLADPGGRFWDVVRWATVGR